MLHHKPHTAILTDVTDQPGRPEDADETHSLRCQITPLKPEESIRHGGIMDINKGFLVLCEIHATLHNVPLGGTFVIRDGQKITWGGSTFITRGDPQEYRIGRQADHMSFVMEKTHGG